MNVGIDNHFKIALWMMAVLKTPSQVSN